MSVARRVWQPPPACARGTPGLGAPARRTRLCSTLQYVLRSSVTARRRRCEATFESFHRAATARPRRTSTRARCWANDEPFARRPTAVLFRGQAERLYPMAAEPCPRGCCCAGPKGPLVRSAPGASHVARNPRDTRPDATSLLLDTGRASHYTQRIPHRLRSTDWPLAALLRRTGARRGFRFSGCSRCLHSQSREWEQE